MIKIMHVQTVSHFSSLVKTLSHETTSSDIESVLVDNITDIFRKGMDDFQYYKTSSLLLF